MTSIDTSLISELFSQRRNKAYLTSKIAKNYCFFLSDIYILQRTFDHFDPPDIRLYLYGKYRLYLSYI